MVKLRDGVITVCEDMPTVHLLDYVAGNVRSLANAIEKLGYTIEWINAPNDIEKAEVSTWRYANHDIAKFQLSDINH